MYKAIDPVYVGALYKRGDLFDADDKNVAELLKDGHIERVKEKPHAKPAVEPDPPVETPDVVPPEEPTVEEKAKNASPVVKKMNANRKVGADNSEEE